MIEMIGMGCRFPGEVNDPNSFWNLLCSKQTAIRLMPSERWTTAEGNPVVSIEGSITERAGWLSRIDSFDHRYFHISPREASDMDPQQRLVLEVALEAIWDAQIHPSLLHEYRTGVFVGAGFAEFQGLSFANPEHMTKHSMLGTSLSIIANRLSYVLDLQGPSMTIDTACSSALSALHLACQSLRTGECDLAIVAGVNAMVTPSPFVGYTQASMLSSTGTCSPFDAKANGFVRGEGCGVVILRRAEPNKRLAHRRVYACIQADGVGEDGHTPSVTMPSGESQQRLMQEVIAKIPRPPEDIVYVEAHGTGTPVGDPIEAHSISRAHRGHRLQPLAIGSVKGHLGHLETAAGIAGLIKAALCLYHNALVPTVGFSQWSPKIDADALHLRLPVDVEPLPPTRTGQPPLIGVCSYGFGGANAYAILMQAPTPDLSEHGESTLSEQSTYSSVSNTFALPLSAHYPEGLEPQVTAWQHVPTHDLREAALWASVSRPALPYRKIWIGEAQADFFSQATSFSGEYTGQERDLIFFLGGQGSHYPHMGRTLYAQHPIYRKSIEQADAIFAKHSGYSLIQQYGLCQRDMSSNDLADVRVSLPCIVLSQVALCLLLKELGIIPRAVMGHSTGEMVAGWLAGAYDLDTLCLLTFIRADMQATMQPGAMLAWQQTEQEAQAILHDLGLDQKVVVAAENTHNSVTLSGDMDAIDALVDWGKQKNIRCLKLSVPRAYHSHHIDPVADTLWQRLQCIQSNVPNIPLISTVQGFDGQRIQQPLDAQYWMKNIRQPVRFAAACVEAEKTGHIGLEISPHRVLSGYLAQNMSIPIFSCLDRNKQDDQSMLQTLGQLYVRGIDVRWWGWQSPSRFVSIPRLPWKHDISHRSKVWKMPGQAASQPVRAPSPHHREIVVHPDTHAYLRDHGLGDHITMPGAGYIAEILQHMGKTSLWNIQFRRFLRLWEQETKTLLRVETDRDSISLHKDDVCYVTASWQPMNPTQQEPLEPRGLSVIRQHCTDTLDIRRLYSAYAKHSGLSFGPSFQGIQQMNLGDGEGLAVLKPPASSVKVPIHTTVLDACFQSLALLRGLDKDAWLPQSLAGVWLDMRLPSAPILAHVRLRDMGRDTLTGDCDLYTESGQRIAGWRGLSLVRVSLLPQHAIECLTLSFQPVEMESVKTSVVPTKTLPVACVLGSWATHWPHVHTQTLTDAEIVVDTRNSLDTASALLREVRDTHRRLPVVFVYPTESETQTPSPILGLARAARNENPAFPVYACGIPVQDHLQQQVSALYALLQLISADEYADEYEWLWQNGNWCVPRLQRYPGLTTLPTEVQQDFRLVVEQPGQLATLKWKPIRPEFEGIRPGEVRIQVSHVSLHFKDVMLAMNLLGDFKPILGMECCGTILELGPDVANEFPELKPGMEVLCLTMTTDVGEFRASLLGTVATVQARQVIPKPEQIPAHQAAGFLGVTATAWYALCDVGRLQPGETVLIHSGAGGVGQAAIQIAQKLGATVISSAGSEEKRNWLRKRFALDCVLDSHQPDTFYQRTQSYTRGQGVDVVLNSLTEQGLNESLRCLRPAGRHLEIGKRDILSNHTVSLGFLKQNISFHSIQLDFLDDSHPTLVRRLLLDCVQRLNTGALTTIETTVYPAEQAIEAFRLISAGKHRGKLVISIPNGFIPQHWQEQSPEEKVKSIPQPWIHSQETQLITGGTRGLGLELARFLAEQGAEHLVLLGKSKHISQKTQSILANIRKEHPHCHIQILPIDVRDRAALQTLFDTCQPPITGVFHTANVYTTEEAHTVGSRHPDSYEVKVQGAMNLHEVSQPYSLRHFVLFSSLAGLHGNIQQATYVAANAALQQLATMRRDTGLPALAIDFPIMLGAGRLSESSYVRELELNTSRGFGAVSFVRLEPWLAQLLAYPDLTPAHVSLDVPNWHGYLQLQRYRRLYQHLIPTDISISTPVEDISETERTTTSTEHVTLITPSVVPVPSLEIAMKAKVAFLLGCRPEEISTATALPDMGVDSLAAIEFSSWLSQEYQIPISQADVLGGVTLQRILDKHSGGKSKTPSVQNSPQQTTPRSDSTTKPHRKIPNDVTPRSDDAAQQHQKISDDVTPRSDDAAKQHRKIADDVELNTISSSETVSNSTLFVPETLPIVALRDLSQRMEQARDVLVFRAAAGQEHFCTGMDLQTMSFGEAEMSEGLEYFARLYQALNAYAMPTIAVVDGACMGGGMLFPLMATVVLATNKASFGFPEVRRGGVPGVVSLAAQRRLSYGQCQRWMATGDVVHADHALRIGLVDFVGHPEDVEKELQRILGRFRTIPRDTLRLCTTHCPSPSLSQALVTMGAVQTPVEPFAHPTENTKEKVRVSFQQETGIAILELHDPQRSNAMGLEIAADLKKAIQTLQQQPGLRAVVFQGAGEHFCVGVNPHDFVRRMQQLPLLQAAHTIYETYRTFVGIRDLNVPVVCIAHGKVLGGGLATMLHADYRISTTDSTFHYGNLSRGVCPGLLLSENLERMVGGTEAMRLYLQDHTLTAEEAHTLGLIHDVAPTLAQAQQQALSLAQHLATAPAQGIQSSLLLMRPVVDEQRLAQESLEMAKCLTRGGAFSGQVPNQTKPMPAPRERTNAKAQHVGILGMELYTPSHRVRQEDLERMDEQPGKYTKGLGQEEIGFCCDDEDAVSMALTVVERFMNQYNISWHKIGRLEVGTESLTDRSKSIKTHLMSLFAKHGNCHIEGIDTYNACYGGTAALFNTVAWCQSESWDGRYGLVVCVDIADLNPEQRFLNGAAAVAMLIGPDAPLVMYPERSTHMMHTWDFYKPVGWKDSYPLMRDGKHSIDVYMQSLDQCQEQLTQKLGGLCPVQHHDYLVFHCTSVYLCKRAFERMVANSPTLREISLQSRQQLYQAKTYPSTLLTRRIGSTYTASCYVNLYSLLMHEYRDLLGKSICMYSYGSGSSASMYRLFVRSIPDMIDTQVMQTLEQRQLHTPQEFVSLVHQYSSTYGTFDFSPSHQTDRIPGVYYLERVDSLGRRFYQRY